MIVEPKITVVDTVNMPMLTFIQRGTVMPMVCVTGEGHVLVMGDVGDIPVVDVDALIEDLQTADRIRGGVVCPRI